jgi:hypothetical protein
MIQNEMNRMIQAENLEQSVKDVRIVSKASRFVQVRRHHLRNGGIVIVRSVYYSYFWNERTLNNNVNKVDDRQVGNSMFLRFNIESLPT